jgi:hypothetical protein
MSTKIKTWAQRCNEHPDHQSGMISERMIQARMLEEIEELREHLARATQRLRTQAKEQADAARYRWLKGRRTLFLQTDGATWTRPDKSKFVASHMLSADQTNYGSAKTLDELIDRAMKDEP